MPLPIQNRRGLLRRYRGTLVFVAASVGTLLAVGSVTLYLVKQWLYKQQLKIAEEHFVREQIKRRFNQTQSDSLATLYELVQVSSLVYDQNGLNLDEVMIALRDKKLQRGSTDKAGKGSGETSGNSSVTGFTTVLNDKVDARSVKSSDTVALKEKSKGELWNDLKIKSIVKLVTITYTTSCLLLLTRLQLNILTRKEYLETVVKATKEKAQESQNGSAGILGWVSNKLWWGSTPNSANGSDQTASTSSKYGDLTAEHKHRTPKDKIEYINEQAFLSLCWWVINRGWMKIHTLVDREVRVEFNTLDPKSTQTVEQFSERLTKVYYRVNKELFLINEEEQERPLLGVLIPRTSQQMKNVLEQAMDLESLQLLEQDDTVLKQLCNEMEQYMKSEATSIVMEQSINESYDYAINEIENNVKRRKQTDIQMALYALSCKECCDKMLKTNLISMDNDYLMVLDGITVLDDLSAMVYSNFGL
ncbi:Peroxisomal biogenesis factor 3 [Nakaseomyces bracarensis]|uniref:Peroxin-3 n=1 Tax=Nakaseomyces bracarensis TaxID=273131 RepID=A0ABR4NVI8_9SACH